MKRPKIKPIGILGLKTNQRGKKESPPHSRAPPASLITYYFWMCRCSGACRAPAGRLASGEVPPPQRINRDGLPALYLEIMSVAKQAAWNAAVKYLWCMKGEHENWMWEILSSGWTFSGELKWNLFFQPVFVIAETGHLGSIFLCLFTVGGRKKVEQHADAFTKTMKQ